MGPRIIRHLCSIGRLGGNSSPYVRPATDQTHLRLPSPPPPQDVYTRNLGSYRRRAQETSAGVHEMSVVLGKSVQSEQSELGVLAILFPPSQARHDSSPSGRTGPHCRYDGTMFWRVGCKEACS